MRRGVPVVLAGDYNVVPTDRDIYPPNPMPRTRCCSRKAAPCFDAFSTQGWIDAIRARHPHEPMYTFWDYMRNRWPRDAGLRIDHLLLSSQAPGASSMQALTVTCARRKARAITLRPGWCCVMLRAAAARRSDRRGKVVRDRARPRVVRQGAAGAKAPLARPGRCSSSTAIPSRTAPIMRCRNPSCARGGRPAGAILGFANFLLRFYREEEPRAVLVAWDSLGVPTYRHEQFAAYQSGREFDDALVDQLDVLPQFVAACGFANAKAAGYEADDFVAAAAAREERRGGTVRVASGDRDMFQLASDEHDNSLSRPRRRGGPDRPGRGPRPLWGRAGAGPRFHCVARRPVRPHPGRRRGLARREPRTCCANMGRWRARSRQAAFPRLPRQLRLFRAIATMDRKAPLPRLADQTPTWRKAAELARKWELSSSLNGSRRSPRKPSRRGPAPAPGEPRATNGRARFQVRRGSAE